MIDQLLKATQEERWPEAEKLLYRHWVSTAQDVYPALIKEPWNNFLDEVKIDNELIHPLAQMFCVGTPAQEEIKEKGHRNISLRKLNEIANVEDVKSKGGICGRMFRNGEPNYSCKECATDGTCVLCYECFVNSAHINHKYKMHTSMGSGYCDCGDIEAWSNDYFCKLHIPKIKEEEEMEEEKTENMDYNGLPSNLVNRFHHLSQITIKFAVSVLCWDRTEELPSTVDVDWIRLEDEISHTILFNDETHTYEGVIRALKLAIFVAHDKAMMIASIVDRDGRSIVQTGVRQRCSEVKQIIEDRTRKEANLRTQKTGPLLVKVFRSSLSGLQLLAIRLINWLSQQAQDCSILAQIISEVLLCLTSECNSVLTSPINSKLAEKVKNRFGLQECLSEEHEGHSLYSTIFLLFDRRLWKAARTAFHQLIMATVLMNIEHKYIFGRLFLENYNIVFEDFINDDHEHSVSITSMSVQIFTVPTIAKRLIADANAIYVCMNGLRTFCSKYLKANNSIPRMDFSTDSYPAVLRRALYMVNDVSYLLTVVPKPNEWTFELRKNIVNGSHAFLRFLAYMQNMDEIKRQVSEHQLMEVLSEVAVRDKLDWASSFFSAAEKDVM